MASKRGADKRNRARLKKIIAKRVKDKLTSAFSHYYTFEEMRQRAAKVYREIKRTL